MNLVDGRYDIESELGRGAMGVVYLAKDINLGRPVALKVITPLLAQNPRFAANLQREAVALASIRSDHVVQVYAFGMHCGSYFFAMELVSGRNLSDILKDHAKHGKQVPLKRALTILRQIASGLDAVHAAGIVHRDIKPANIVIEERSGRAVLVDFGLALPVDREASQVGGTPPYMSPEQLRGRPLTARSDVYSFACTAFKLLTGKTPFAGENILDFIAHHASDKAPLVSTYAPDHALFDAAISKALSKAPELRHATCGELAQELSDAIRPRVTPVPPAVAQPSEKPGTLTVLVIDDDPAFIRFAAQAVQLAFYGVPMHVMTAPNGMAAIEQAAQRPPHLVLLDYDMPGLDGVGTLARLRDLPSGGAARVIVVSATAGQAEAWRFSVLGVQDFLRKPVQIHALVAAVELVAKRAGWGTGMDAIKVRGGRA